MKKEECALCADNVDKVDYKSKEFLRKFTTAQFKVATSRRNNLCNRHQRMISNAIKIARYMALIPYTRLQISKRLLSH